MEEIKKLFESVRQRLSGAALKDAVVAKPLTVGGRHVVVLAEVSVLFGGGGGDGEAPAGSRRAKGSGGGSGGMGKASPVAALVVEDGKVRLERLGNQ